MMDVIKKGIRVRRTECVATFATGMTAPIGSHAVRESVVLLALLCSFVLICCQESRSETPPTSPVIEFTTIPIIGENDAAGDPGRISFIKGRVIGAKPGQQIVIYARAFNVHGQLEWFVQPLVNEPFTKIDSESRWHTSTHPGAEYAALLVEDSFQPPGTTSVLPTQGVLAVAFTKGEPAIWHRWWFVPAGVIVCAAAVLGLHRLRIYEMSRKLHLRFEERLAERNRVAQELHDTLLQGVLSASIQLHVAVDQLPEDSPSLPILNRVLELLGQVVEEGRTTLRGLRSPVDNARDLESSFSRIPQELGAQPGVDFRVFVEGTPLALRSIIRDDVYSIGREALVNAFRHSRPRRIDVQLEYAPSHLRVLVRDDGCGIDAKVLASGRDGHYGLSVMRERAERIGARLKVLSRPGNGTEVDLRVPSDIAFESAPPSPASKSLSRLQRPSATNHRRFKVG